MGNRKPQFAVTRLQFHVAEVSNFSKAFSSVQFSSIQFSSFLFSQNIIHIHIHIGIVRNCVGNVRNTYRNCKAAREPGRNQKAYEPWAPQSQRRSKIK